MAQPARVPVPNWLKKMLKEAKDSNDAAFQNVFKYTCGSLAEYKLNTICDGAKCPNRQSCFSKGTATFLILGKYCTRNCAFCAVDHHPPEPVDADEPRRLKEAVRTMALKHVVITAVTRDDLPDGGAEHFVNIINELRTLEDAPIVEVLTSDFKGDMSAVDKVMAAKPEIFSHNVEMVPRLYTQIRPGALYKRSLEVLKRGIEKATGGTAIKTGFMLGLGETFEETIGLLEDLRETGVQMLTIGQYLAPTMRHYPVQRYVEPGEFDEIAARAYAMGFASVASGPLVRSSYHAGDYYSEMNKK